MMDKNFDRILEEKLKRIKVDFDPESWQLFEQRLDADLAGTPEVKDTELDEAVFDKLHRYEVPFNPNHWHLMSSRLTEEFTLARQILRYKVLELGLVGLLLLTIVQYLPLQSTLPQPANTPIPQQIETVPAQNQKSKDGSDQPLQQPARAVAEADLVAPVLEKTPLTKAEPLTQNIRTSAEEDVQKSKSLDLPGTSRPQLAIPPLGNEIDLAEKFRSENQALSSLTLESEPKRSLSTNSFELHDEEFVTAALDPLSPGLLSYGDQEDEFILEYQQPKRKTYFRVGMFGGADYNKVITPANAQLGLNRLSRYTAGYSGGVTFGWEFGKWETETGLIYSAKQYQALPILFFQGSFKDGYLGRGVKDIVINGLNVPLHLRYNFLRNDKWRMYVLGGASIQVAVQANYYTANQEGFRSSSFAPAPAPTSAGRTNYNSFRTLADDLPGGWFEGGSFKENGYLTANAGLGLERYFSGQWSIFMQPTYQHAVNYFLRGLGPTEDEISTFSLYTGIRLRLQK